jgi:hypothetical protein
MLFKEIIAVYSEKHTKPINKKCSITDCHSKWFILLPLGIKGLNKIGVRRWTTYTGEWREMCEAAKVLQERS